MSGFASQTGGYKNITATANVSPIPCKVLGVFVSTETTATVQLYDSATTTTTAPIVSVFTPVAATYYTIPASASSGIYVVISGTVSATVFFG